jgi:hypothetical protein
VFEQDGSIAHLEGVTVSGHTAVGAAPGAASTTLLLSSYIAIVVSESELSAKGVYCRQQPLLPDVIVHIM